MKIKENRAYCTAAEAIHQIGGSRPSFNKNVKPFLRPYHFDGRKAPYYDQEEVIGIATGKPIRKRTIPITDMFSDWTQHAIDLGYNAETINCVVDVQAAPPALETVFKGSSSEIFVRRERMTFIDGDPVCYWSTYYPHSLVDSILPEIKFQAPNIREHIEKTHSLFIHFTHTVTSTRMTTGEEVERFHLYHHEPVLVTQRMATSEDGTLILFSDMVLLGSSFVISQLSSLS